MHTLYFETDVLLIHRDGQQHEGLVYLHGPNPDAHPFDTWDAVFALTEDAARAVRTVDVIADLDDLCQRAHEPGADEEYLTLTLPLETDDQSRHDAAVQAYWKTPQDGSASTPAVKTACVLVRRLDLRGLAIEMYQLRIQEKMEANLTPSDRLSRLEVLGMQQKLLDTLGLLLA